MARRRSSTTSGAVTARGPAASAPINGPTSPPSWTCWRKVCSAPQVAARLSLADAAEALQIAESRTKIGKVVLLP